MNRESDSEGCNQRAADDEPPGSIVQLVASPWLVSAAPGGDSSPHLTALLLDKSEPPGKRRRRSPTRLNQETPAPHFSTNRITSFDLLSRSQRTSGSPRTRSFRRRFFPDAPDSQWNNWRWQSQHRIRSLEQMERMLTLSDDERHAMQMGGTMLPVGITPYYMSLLDPDDPQQPLRRTVIPTSGEFIRTAGEADDPLGEDGHSPLPGSFTATRTACCCWRSTSVRPTAAIAPVHELSGMARSP